MPLGQNPVIENTREVIETRETNNFEWLKFKLEYEDEILVKLVRVTSFYLYFQLKHIKHYFLFHYK